VVRVGLIPGDGIGVEVLREARRVLEEAARIHGIALELREWDLGADRTLRTGVTISEEEFRSLAEEHDVLLLGAMGDPRIPDHRHARDILLGLRFRLDLYVNFRPNVLLVPGLSPLRGMEGREVNIEIFRENTEGIYVNMGGNLREGTPDEIAVQEDVNTRRGVERIIRAAFQYAAARGRTRVTLVDKANAMPAAGALWRRAFHEVAGEFERSHPEIRSDAAYVDAMAMELVRRPQDYQVLVTSNLFGDILSDLAAAVTGGLGLAASANLHPGRHALFEPVHGSAPDIAGKGVANPLGAVACVVLLLDHLGHGEAARRVDGAVRRVVAAGAVTPDLGGSLGTGEVGDRLLVELENSDGGDTLLQW
jgi:3-isopropylmalate dehydrogenase